jgi:hypothetical protein
LAILHAASIAARVGANPSTIHPIDSSISIASILTAGLQINAPKIRSIVITASRPYNQFFVKVKNGYDNPGLYLPKLKSHPTLLAVGGAEWGRENKKAFLSVFHVMVLKFGNSSALESSHHHRFRNNSSYYCDYLIDKC